MSYDHRAVIEECNRAYKQWHDAYGQVISKRQSLTKLSAFVKAKGLDWHSLEQQIKYRLNRHGSSWMPNDVRVEYGEYRTCLRRADRLEDVYQRLDIHADTAKLWDKFLTFGTIGDRRGSINNEVADVNLHGNYAVWTHDAKINLDSYDVAELVNLIVSTPATFLLWGQEEEQKLKELRSAISVVLGTPNHFPGVLQEAEKLFPIGQYTWPNSQRIPLNWKITHRDGFTALDNDEDVGNYLQMLHQSKDYINTLTDYLFALIRDVFLPHAYSKPKRSVDEDAEEPAKKRTK